MNDKKYSSKQKKIFFTMLIAFTFITYCIIITFNTKKLSINPYTSIERYYIDINSENVVFNDMKNTDGNLEILSKDSFFELQTGNSAFIHNIIMHIKTDEKLKIRLYYSDKEQFDNEKYQEITLKNGSNTIYADYNWNTKYIKILFNDDSLINNELSISNIEVNSINALLKKATIELLITLIICLSLFLYAIKYQSFNLYINNLFSSSQKNRIKKFFNSNLFIFISSGFLGALFFIFVYGTKILDFTYTDWLMKGGDLTQHYLGWEFFRNSNWSFPIGLVDCFIYPFKESIMYSDSIPLFAVFFKIISPILPNDFQYFGLFGILVYILQGGFGGLIIKKLTDNTPVSIIGSLFFTISAFLTWRMYAHTALSAHFLILASIYICITKDNANRNIKINSLSWAILLSLSVSIHPYFVPMVFVFIFVYFIDDVIEYKKILKFLPEIIIPVVLLFFTMFLLGAFYSGKSNAGGGLGHYGTNLNSIIDPENSSYFLKQLRRATSGQYEGNAYIGYGGILLAVLGLYIFIDKFHIYKNKFLEKKVRHRFILCIFIILSFYILALSPVVTLNDKILFIYKTPEFITKIWSIFRATGRLIWPVVYIIIISSICIIVKNSKKITSVIIISALVFIQFKDLSGYFNSKGKYFKEKQVWETSLKSDLWSDIANKYNHFVFMENFNKEYPIAKFAEKNKLTISDMYLARKDGDLINTYKQYQWSQLDGGYADDTFIYLFSNYPVAQIFSNLIYVYEVDGMILGFSKILDNYGDFSDVKYINSSDGIDIMPPEDKNKRNATCNENKVNLDKNGAMWTNYYDLPAGIYSYEWTGNNLENARFDMSYEDGRNTIELIDIEKSNTSFKFSVLIEKDTKNLHARCFNNSEENISIDSVKIFKKAV